MNRNRLPREGVWDGSWKRIADPNASEPLRGCLAWASVRANTTPDIRSWPGSREGGDGEKSLNLTPRDLFRSARAVGRQKETTNDRCLKRSRIVP